MRDQNLYAFSIGQCRQHNDTLVDDDIYQNPPTLTESCIYSSVVVDDLLFIYRLKRQAWTISNRYNWSGFTCFYETRKIDLPVDWPCSDGDGIRSVTPWQVWRQTKNKPSHKSHIILQCNIDHSILVVSHCNIAVTKFQKKTCTQTIGVLFALHRLEIKAQASICMLWHAFSKRNMRETKRDVCHSAILM